jgi:hypothetical protein
MTLTALFSTCSSSDGGDGGGSGSSDATTLAGTWQTACTADPGKPGYAFTDKRSFDGTAFTTEFSSYADSDCKSLVMAQSQSGTFSLGDILEVEEGVAPQQLDIVINAVFVTLNTEPLVQAYNDRSFCGGGWELGVKRQITKQDCAGAAGGDDTGEDHIFEIYALQDGQLYFGAKDADHSGRGAATRPVSLDLAKPYSK